MQHTSVRSIGEHPVRQPRIYAPQARAPAIAPADVATSIEDFLHARAIGFRNVWRGAHCLAANSIAKTLLLIDDDAGHALALVAQGRWIDIEAINRRFRRSFHLGGLDDIRRLYPGLPPQALWPTGIAAGVEVFVDDILDRVDEVAFDTTDPRCLTVITGDDFRRISRQAARGSISRPI
jgi:prolyl-tRNA editing enzyme YbaK/EbsC (Cys-tRNA(Pro) deacylase)